MPVPQPERDFGSRVQRARKARGMTQQALSDSVVTLTRAAIAKIESGVRGVSLSDAIALSRALDVPLDGLIAEGPISLEVEV
jgi:transcriptional regulator with XRE-family HTH domain